MIEKRWITVEERMKETRGTLYSFDSVRKVVSCSIDFGVKLYYTLKKRRKKRQKEEKSPILKLRVTQNRPDTEKS